VKKLNPRKLYIIGSVLAMLLVIVGMLLRFPPGPRPVCHRAIDGALQQWMLESGHTNSYPNADGHGSASLAMIQRYFGDGIQQYGYVPGLRDGDPAGLVFMYLKRKTRYSWHGDTQHGAFSPRRWMVLSPSFSPGSPGNTCPEGGELLDTSEFKKRIQITIAFLKEQQRPYWQDVADEQSEFLKSIKE